MDKHTNIEEEIQLLLRSIRDKHFSFILVQYNHKSAVQLVKDRIAITYPNRPTLNIITDGIDYRRLMDSIYQQSEGIVYIEDFDHLLKNPELYQGFNMRRDKISDQPIALIGFMLKGKANITRAMENIADMWSVRSLVAEIDVPIPEQNFQFIIPEFREISTLGGANMEDKEVELERLKKKLERLPNTSINFDVRHNLYQQIEHLCRDIGDYKLGLKYAEERLQFIENQNNEKENLLNLADVYDRMMTFYRYLGDYKSSLIYGQKALEIAQKENIHRLTGMYQNNLAIVYRHLGMYEKARDLFESALHISTDFFGEKHITSLYTLSNLAHVYGWLGEHEKARDLLEATLKTNIDNYGSNDPTIAIRQSNLANIYNSLGDYEKAEKVLESAMKILYEYFGESHPETAAAYMNLANVYIQQRKWNKALQLLEKAYEILSQTNSKNYFDLNKLNRMIQTLQQKLTPTQ